MKRTIFCVLMVLITLVINSIFTINIFGEQLSPCIDSDECGKVVGRIIDNDTNELVNEIFMVTIIPFKDGKIQPKEYYAKQTVNGYFSISVKPGRYIIAFSSISKDSKYPTFFNPNHPPEEKQIVTIEKGKITDVTKVVSEGGGLRVMLVDSDGLKINLLEYFENVKVQLSLKNDTIGYFSTITMDNGQIETGEIIINKMIPGTYSIKVYFPESGYAAIEEEFVIIERKKTAEHKVVITLDKDTGIHGFVKDKDGIPIKYAEVVIFKDIENYGVVGFADTISNENGYYKMIGIKDGIYSLRVEGEIDEVYIHNITIEKNKLISMDIILKSK